MSETTMGAIAKRYDERRADILEAIADRRVSASMSGIEYYPKPWSELDMADDGDAFLVFALLRWRPS